MKSTIQRIKQYIDFKGLTVSSFEKSTGMSNGSFSCQLKNNKTIGVDKLENILRTYPELNPEWLLTGKGTMLLFPTVEKENTISQTSIRAQEEKEENRSMSDSEKIDTLIRANKTLSDASFILAQTTQDAVKMAKETIIYDRERDNSNRLILDKLLLLLDGSKKKLRITPTSSTLT